MVVRRNHLAAAPKQDRRIHDVEESIVSIPIVMWKLLETHELRLAAQTKAFVRSTLPAHDKTGMGPVKSNRKAQPSTETVSSAQIYPPIAGRDNARTVRV